MFNKKTDSAIPQISMLVAVIMLLIVTNKNGNIIRNEVATPLMKVGVAIILFVSSIPFFLINIGKEKLQDKFSKIVSLGMGVFLLVGSLIVGIAYLIKL